MAKFKTKLATPIQFEPGNWEVSLVKISYPKGYKNLFLLNTLRLDSAEISLPVKHYESVNDLLTNPPLFGSRIKRKICQ